MTSLIPTSSRASKVEALVDVLRLDMSTRNELADRFSRAQGAVAHMVPRAQATLTHRQRWESSYRKRLMLTDGTVVVLVTLLCALVGSHSASDLTTALLVHVATAMVWLTMLGAFQSRSSRLVGSGTTEYTRLLQATAAAFGFLAMLFTILGGGAEFRTQLLYGLPIGIAGLLGGRWLWRVWLHRQRRAGMYLSRALLVGDRREVSLLAQTLCKDPDHCVYTVVGAAIGDGSHEDIVIGSTRIPVVGDWTHVPELARDVGADSILLANKPEQDPEYVKRLGWQLEGAAAELVLSSQIADVAGPRISVTHIDGLPLIRVRIPTFMGADYAIKRVADVCLSLLALVPIAMITPVIAVALKLDSPGPVFFRQDRVGCDGRIFRMIKFRSMSTTAEQDLETLKAMNEGAGVLFKMKDDPRVTRVGRVLRKFSLDELPQFWNVLVGDMSIVGPRPPLPSEVLEYDRTVWRRLFIKPGITGLWQVSGRSDLTWEESVRLDLRYVENWSVMSDFVIMLRTARAIFTSSGAY